jgi:hypothetical protein
MANVLITPLSGAIIFNNLSAGSSTISPLSSAPRLQYDNAGGLNISSLTSATSAQDRFTVDGINGRLFSISDTLLGSIFTVNDIAGFPIIEVTTGAVDTVNIGSFGTNALVVSGANTSFGGNVGIGTATPNERLAVIGAISSTILYMLQEVILIYGIAHIIQLAH